MEFYHKNIGTTHINQIIEILKQHIDTDFRGYKHSTISRRIQKRMNTLRIVDIEKYVQYISDTYQEQHQLSQELLINVTAFFRDMDVFEEIENQIIPQLLLNIQKGKVIRIWVCGCATGEEAYSIAMLIKELEEQEGKSYPIKIVATDIKETAISKAKSGSYNLKEVANLSEARLKKFFIKKGKEYVVKSFLKKMILFAIHDLTQDPPFGKIDLLTCRNLLIYLDKEAQQKVLNNFNFSINLNGFLILGKSETAVNLSSNFKTYDSRLKIYTKKSDKRAGFRYNFRVTQQEQVEHNSILNLKMDSHMSDKVANLSFQNLIQKKYGPAIVIIDRECMIQYITQNAQKYIDTPEDFTRIHSFLDYAPKPIAAIIRAHMEQQFKDLPETGLVFKQIYLKEQEGLLVDLTIEVLTDDGMPSKQFIAIKLVESEAKHKVTSQEEQDDTNNIFNEVHSKLQDQLIQIEYKLKKTILELEHSNQNLLSSNEELQSTNEEYISVNEELQNINGEYQKTIEELSQVDRDIDLLLQHAEISTIFLDKDFLIRRYTKAIEQIINVRQVDINRSFKHLTHNLQSIDLIALIQKVQETKEGLKVEVLHENGAKYLLKIVPYTFEQTFLGGVVMSFTDITYKVQYEKQLQQNEAKFRTVFNNTFDYIGLFDKDKKLIDINDKALKYLSIPKEMILNKAIWKAKYGTYNKQYEQVIEANLQKALDGEMVRYQVEIILGEGKMGVLDVVLNPYINENGTTVFIIATARDITQMKQIEKAFRVGERRYKRMFESAFDGLIIFDIMSRKIVDCNQKTLEIFGYTKEEMLEKSPVKLSPAVQPNGKKTAVWAEEIVRNGLKTGKVDYEWVYQKKDGTLFWVRTYGYMVSDEERHLFFSIIKDISQERETKRILEESEAKFRAIFDNACHFAALINTTGEIVEINNATLEFGNINRSDIVGKHVTEFLEQYTFEEDLEKYQKAVLNLRAGNLSRVIVSVRDSKLNKRIMDISMNPILDSNQNILAIVVEAIDITDLKNYQQQLKDKVSELNSKNEELKRYIDANLELEKFAYIASHDLKEPLRSIISFSEILQHKYQTLFDKNANRYMNYIIESGKKMNRFIEDLLQFSRINTVSLFFEELPIRATIEEVLTILEASIKENKVEIELNIAEDIDNIRANKTMFKQLLQNLLINAIKFRRGNVVPKIVITVQNKEQYWHFEVKDNGLGIDKKFHDTIFLLFKRVNTNTEETGTGIGLAICKKVIEKHQGNIRCESQLGLGTNFIFALPKQIQMSNS